MKPGGPKYGGIPKKKNIARNRLAISAVRTKICIGEGTQNKFTPEPQGFRLGAFQVPKCTLSCLKVLGFRVVLSSLELMNRKGQFRPGPVRNPGQRANHRPVSVSIREFSFETRSRGEINGMIHGSFAGRQVVKSELGDSILDEGSLREIEKLVGQL